MSDERFERAREALPDRVAGRLGAGEAGEVDAVVREHAELAAEAELLEALHAGRPEPPEDLASRITAAIRRERPAGGRSAGGLHLPRWALGAAAVAVLALGSLEMMEHQEVAAPPLDLLALDDAHTTWLSDGGLVAGAPVLDDLSDEELTTLLEELGG